MKSANRFKPRARTIAVWGTSLFWTSSLVGHSALITFENGNFGVTAVDNQVITNQYQAGAGVTFYRGNSTSGAAIVSGGLGAIQEQKGPGTTPVTGDPESGYGPGGAPGSGLQIGYNYNPEPGDPLGVLQRSDIVATGAGLDGLTQAQRDAYLGDWFLRTSSFSVESLVVVFDTPVSASSFEIWDIDGTAVPSATTGEQWFVDAYNGDWTTVVASTSTPYIAGGPSAGSFDTLSYDGQPVFVSLTGTTFDRFIVHFGVGPAYKTAGAVGLAFNNFNTTAVPEPGTAVLLAAASGILAACSRKNPFREKKGLHCCPKKRLS